MVMQLFNLFYLQWYFSFVYTSDDWNMQYRSSVSKINNDWTTQLVGCLWILAICCCFILLNLIFSFFVSLIPKSSWFQYIFHLESSCKISFFLRTLISHADIKALLFFVTHCASEIIISPLRSSLVLSYWLSITLLSASIVLFHILSFSQFIALV